MKKQKKLMLKEKVMSENTSGLQPIEFKVLIKPDDVSDTDPVLKKAKESGFILAPSEHEEAAQVKGTVIAVGGRAFHDFGDPSPKVGDRIYFAKYSGLVIAGDDGQEYRLMNDKDVAAIVKIAEVAA